MQTALDLGWTLVTYEADAFKWLSAGMALIFQTLAIQPNVSILFSSIKQT